MDSFKHGFMLVCTSLLHVVGFILFPVTTVAIEDEELNINFGSAVFSLPHKFNSLWLRFKDKFPVGDANRFIEELFFKDDSIQSDELTPVGVEAGAALDLNSESSTTLE